jgi:hypothetical protein
MAALVGIAASCGVLASAASLGLNGRTLGAGTAVIASCDTNGVALTYVNAFHRATGQYRTTRVIVRNIAPACAGARLRITLRNAANAAIGTGTIASLGAGPNANVLLTTPAPAAAVVGAAVVIAR